MPERRGVGAQCLLDTSNCHAGAERRRRRVLTYGEQLPRAERRVSTPTLRLTRATVTPEQATGLLRPQDSNLDLTAPKAVVLPLHQGGSRETRASSLPERGAPSVWGGRGMLAASKSSASPRPTPSAAPAIMKR